MSQLDSKAGTVTLRSWGRRQDKSAGPVRSVCLSNCTLGEKRGTKTCFIACLTFFLATPGPSAPSKPRTVIDNSSDEPALRCTRQESFSNIPKYGVELGTLFFLGVPSPLSRVQSCSPVYYRIFLPPFVTTPRDSLSHRAVCTTSRPVMRIPYKYRVVAVPLKNRIVVNLIDPTSSDLVSIQRQQHIYTPRFLRPPAPKHTRTLHHVTVCWRLRFGPTFIGPNSRKRS